MAADCMTRAWALAIATAACVGLPAALVYEIVRIAAARCFGATCFALSIFLVIWVAASAAYYPRVLADTVRWSALRRCLWGQRARARHPSRGCGVAANGALLPQSVARNQQQDRAGVAAVPREPPNVRGGARIVPVDTLASPYERQRDVALVPLLVPRSRQEAGHGSMDALPRETTAAARGGAQVVAGGTLASYERQRGGEPSERCVVCLCDVEEVETAAWLPACLHMFHRHCIDQWLHQHGHSTCPICRCNAFPTPLLPPPQTTV